MTCRHAFAEHGSAVVAAVFVAASVALIASQVTSTSRSALGAANGDLVHARLVAEAEGGLVRAVAAIQSGAWDLGRGAHMLDDSVDPTTVEVEDERGKAPLNTLTETQVRALFEAVGVDEANLEPLVTAFLDWRDPGRVRRASRPSSAMQGSQEGGFRTVGELRLVPGVSDAIYKALAPSVTVSAGDRAYDPTFSTPVAVETMTPTGVESPAALEAQRQTEGERPVLTTALPTDLASRELTIRVKVERPDGSRVREAWLIEMTGRADRQFLVRGRAD